MTSRRVVRNSAWLIADKVVRLGLGLVVWMWLARQVGPSAFGQWNFAIAFAALFAVVAGLGLDGVLQRELVADDADAPALLGTAAVLRLVAGGVSALVCVAAAWGVRSEQPMVVALVGLNALVFVLQSSQVVDYLFQARMQNRFSVVAVNAAFVAATAIRIVLLWREAPLLWFGATLVIEATLAAMLLLRAARRVDLAPSRWHFDRRVARRLLAQSWPLLFSGMAVIVYMRVDQIMLASMVGDAAVGQFSAALRLSEVWYFVPAAILSAAFPALLARRQDGAAAYERYLQALYDAMAWLGLAVAVAVSFAAPWVVEHLYGPAYAEAARVWQVQTWAGITVAMSYVHGKWLLAEGLQRIGLLYTLAGCVVNLSLNLVLIPRFGAVGAAWATLATQVGLLPMQLIFPETRRNFVMMLKTVGAPLRYWRR
jgi:O-antigen/teichoic acid export membrane protein